ncbi:hypothetical protein PHISCL_02682 [Aspergillus sclerotialis]|uniref:Uncharacterized protein n=1 Tax=Aspergillus sclerotialis TaxID=2070753 RepID=A0A3A3A6I5_9EURO|nr:hypothetical protein PHISCL_02682 [Aspergillus sclerotialis]
MRQGDPELQSIFEHRKRVGYLNNELKRFVLDRLHERKSLEYSHGVLRLLYNALESELQNLETASGQKNWLLRMMLQQLDI